jgi:hypothetical protein
LSLLRTGTGQPDAPGQGRSRITSKPPYRRRLLWCSLLAGCIALFPQALVPLLMKLSGGHARVWFLALYVPGAWQWPVITVMFLLGLASLGVVGWIWAPSPRQCGAFAIAGAAVAGQSQAIPSPERR